MKLTILPGDGVGPEVTDAAVRVLQEIGHVFGLNISTDTALVGGASIRKEGTPLPASTLEKCLASDAVLLGAVGDPEFDQYPPDQRPEKGLLTLRTALGGFANLRPSAAVPALIDASPLKRSVFEGTDLLIVRELLGGLYFGEPRGFSDSGDEAFNTMRYSTAEVERVARVAFEAARTRKKRLTSVDKANVLESSRLWRDTVTKVGLDYPDIELEHLYVDACAMHLVTNPTRFDVVVTENLFGDILSDEAAVLTGSLGMLASATIGGDVDLYEPVHGSAPDIAGKNVANPIGAIASAAMIFRYTAKHEPAARAIENGIELALDKGYRTVDIAEPGCTSILSTEKMGQVITEFAVDASHSARAYHAV